jgi:lipopolysaccharide/colanic/teichoic acid biosynthesis glycosyltransferase/glycosyltransferase involved in cell wall biosynthesis
MSRLAAHLRRTKLVVGFSAGEWRSRMAGGDLRRLRTRLGAAGWFVLRACVQAARRPGSVLVPTTNPFHLPWALLATQGIHRGRVVPLIYDLYPDALEAARGRAARGMLPRIAARLNRWLFRNADGIVFIGHRMAEHAIARYGKPRRWTVIETGADASEFDSVGGSRTELDEWCEQRFTISYVGNLGLMHDWRTFAEAIPRAIEQTHTPMGVVVAASGPGLARLRDCWSELGDDCVRFVPPLGDREWARLLRASALSLVTLTTEAAQTCVPSKAFSAMAAGSAILAVAPPGSDLAQLVTRHSCGEVVAPGEVERLTGAIARIVSTPGEAIQFRRRAREAVLESYDLKHLATRWETFLGEVPTALPPSAGYSVLKRTLDIVVSAAALLVLSPLLLAVAAATRVSSGPGVLFKQQRPGLAARPFKLLKFRTMRPPRPHEEGPEHDENRITRLGRWLRATSVDELPSLLNVLRGELSLVGPRPLLMRYLTRYSPRQRRRHEVKPGITGWAQVNGRNALEWEEKFEHDVWYVDHRSLLLDARIVALSVVRVIRGDGVSQEGHATMPEFRGEDR